MPVNDAFHIYDTTLRDGAQQEGLNLSVHDKLNIARHLDDLGVGFIEGGWPGANPKDTEFFALAKKELKLKNATFVAFGATRRPNANAADDVLLGALRDSGAPAVTLVAKAFDRHVDLALKTSLDENLAMIRDSVTHLREEGQRVFLDAEHFFDGYRSNRAYALEVVRVAAEAGADVIALCDTNGGMLPDELSQIVHDVLTASNARLGIHCHNDTGCAVANSMAAVAAGATRRPNAKAADDVLLGALRDSGAPAVTLVAKAFDRHVDLALKTTLDENLAMIRDSVTHLIQEGQRVFLDAEHFFDGYRSNRAYALEVVRVAAEAGADVIALCDTNGGMLPDELSQVVHDVLTASSARLGIHCHNDTGCAVANSMAAVAAGATHVQGTLNGYGERTGNADLVTIIANLELKKKQFVLPPNALQEAFRISHAVAEVTNVTPSSRQPYVGVSAFAHKAGLHASAIKVDPSLYQHEDPSSVGNDMRMLVSDMAGRASIELKSQELGVDLGGDKELIGRIVDRVKEMESRGFTFEAADASFELLVHEEMSGKRPSFFTINHWVTSVERAVDQSITTKAEVTVTAKGQEITCSGEGNGPVNAFDNALRTGLIALYPELSTLELTDYKVRILEGRLGTGAVTRVLVETSDGRGEWNTVGVHENVIAASAMALEDAVTFGLMRQGRKPE